MAGRLISRPDPMVPVGLRVSGQVVMRVLIGKDGTVERAYAISGPALLRPAHLDAVKKWVYRPYLVDGEAVSVDTTVSVILDFGGPPSGIDPVAVAAKIDQSEGYRVWVAGRLMEPLLVKQVWPKASRKAVGVVEVTTRVNEQGVVERAEAISGPEALRRAVADAVMQWRYSPYLLDGKPVAVSSSASVTFGQNR